MIRRAFIIGEVAAPQNIFARESMSLNGVWRTTPTTN